MSPKIAVLFDNFGPYHLARLNAASELCPVLGIEIHAQSREYGWRPETAPKSFESITLREDSFGTSSMMYQLRQLQDALDCFRPQCVFVPGWSAKYALGALWWCQSQNVPAVLMSETTQSDAPRIRARESVKSWILSMCSAALVGGERHTEYLISLGMPADCIFQGYDAVDNDYFHRMAETARGRSIELAKQFKLHRPYFLAVARFIPKKNLVWLIESYAKYRSACEQLRVCGQNEVQFAPWSLVLLGDGRERAKLERRISEMGLGAHVSLPGFKPYADLPVYYGLSGAFVHASQVEPWGLVINEAMASGLPVLVSNACGCGRDLVREGENGFLFDPANSEQFVELMIRLSTNPKQLDAMGKTSFGVISEWGLDRFATAFITAAERALAVGPKKGGFWKGLLVRWLSRRE